MRKYNFTLIDNRTGETIGFDDENLWDVRIALEHYLKNHFDDGRPEVLPETYKKFMGIKNLPPFNY